MTYTHHAYSWGDMLAQLGQTSRWDRAARTMEYRAEFCPASFEEACSLLQTGWTEGREQLAERLMLTNAPTVKTAHHMLDVAGAYPMVPLAVAGEPACMVTRGFDDQPRHTYRIVASLTAHMYVTADQLYNRGVAICRIIDSIEAAGHRVELIVEYSTERAGKAKKVKVPGLGTRLRARGLGDFVSWSVTAKEAQDPLEVDRIAFVFCHTAMIRRAMFHLQEFTCEEEAWPGRGVTSQPHADHYGEGAIILPGITQDTVENKQIYSSPERATAHVCDLLRAAGIEIETHA